jgi:hypothetical protein
MTNQFVIDASNVFPLTGDWQEVDQRKTANMMSTWTELLCLSPSEAGYALAICIFGALGEEALFDDEEADETELALDPEYLPAFYEGAMVSLREGGYICGPLFDEYTDTIVEFARPNKQVLRDALTQLDWPYSGELIDEIIELAQAKPSGTALPPDLVGAYLSTNYQAQIPSGLCSLRVGSPSQTLLELYKECAIQSAAFITAQNPLGRSLTDAENRVRVNALLADAKGLGLPFFEGEGVGADDSWPPERSLLLLGLSFEQAVHLGRHHDQNAIVWVDKDAVPKLVILR